MSTELAEIFWHDGQLLSLAFETEAREPAVLTLVLALYEGEQSPSRVPYKIICVDVSLFETSLDVRELRDNASAGNIVDGSVTPGTLHLEVTGGEIQVTARSFNVIAC